MAKYRKKPVIIKAFKMGIDNRPDWFQNKVSNDEIITHKVEKGSKKTYCIIKTLEGDMKGDYGDYIIQGVNGEVYACKPDIFHKTYEKV